MHNRYNHKFFPDIVLTHDNKTPGAAPDVPLVA